MGFTGFFKNDFFHESGIRFVSRTQDRT